MNHVVDHIEFVGYRDVYNMCVPGVNNYIANGVVVHNCGKTTLARILAVSHACPHMKLWGDPCPDCWATYVAPDGSLRGPSLHEMNAADEKGIDEMRKLAALSRIRPMGCLKRVIILDEFHKVTSDGASLLLKPMEDPPATTVWIVCTSEPGKVTTALQRRMAVGTYQLKPLGFTEREKFLRRAAEAAKVAQPMEPLIEQVNWAGIGSPGLLLPALERYAAGFPAEEAVAGTEGVSVNSLRICKAATNGDWAALRGNLSAATPDEARWIRSSVAGWIRGAMAKEQDPKRQERCAVSLMDLSANAPIDDASMLIWLWPVLWKICRRWKE